MDPIEKVNDLQAIDCSKNPVESLTQMFVGIVQKGRIARGQCPALRPVFLKPHGVAQGEFRIRPDLPNDLKVGVFAGRSSANRMIARLILSCRTWMSSSSTRLAICVNSQKPESLTKTTQGTWIPTQGQKRSWT